MDHVQDIRKIVNLLKESQQYDKKQESGKPFFVDPAEGQDQNGWFIEINQELHGPFDSKEEAEVYAQTSQKDEPQESWQLNAEDRELHEGEVIALYPELAHATVENVIQMIGEIQKTVRATVRPSLEQLFPDNFAKGERVYDLYINFERAMINLYTALLNTK